MIAGSPLEAHVSVDSASVGPAEPGAHDPRVQRLAREAGLPLAPRCARVFDEIVDIVNYDLVLAMDKFDHEEVSSMFFFPLIFVAASSKQGFAHAIHGTAHWDL